MARYPDLLALTVLGLLSEQPRHPYDLQRLIRSRHKDFAAEKARGLYHAVDRLVRKSLIEPVETNREGRRPERTIYQLTENGRDEFETWLRDLLENPVAEHPVFTAAVSFLCYLPQATACEALQARTVALESEIAGLDAALRVLQENLALPRLFLIEHEFTRALRAAELAWVRGLIDDMTAGRLGWDRAALQELAIAFRQTATA
ncbi:MAG TPA: PadR family transcriptional regulator [Chloroflexota bacterium]|nr:PadR family transcriptional regulator [Chloroflexota bacterium]